MRDTRRDEEFLTTSSMINFIQDKYEQWLENYLASKKSHESGRRSLERLLQRTAARYGFSTQKPQETKLPSVDLIRIKTEFALNFWTKYNAYSPSKIYNVDETAIQCVMPPRRIWGIKGRKGSVKVQGLKKHSGRMTAVLTIRSDGKLYLIFVLCAIVIFLTCYKYYVFRKKLPILFILRGKLGGSIESNELHKLPSSHFYTVHEARWMDTTGWAFYVKKLLKYEIDSPALLLADNFHCHVLDEGACVVAEEACATVVPLPPKSTSVCQPLYVGVMGPLKATIRSLYVPKKGLSVPEKRLRAIEATIAAREKFPINSVIPRYESTTVLLQNKNISFLLIFWFYLSTLTITRVFVSRLFSIRIPFSTSVFCVVLGTHARSSFLIVIVITLFIRVWNFVSSSYSLYRWERRYCSGT
ncbi:hypothetical protein PHPALM_31673 [Phytophthora palmivora]|uniref:DDE-1 domain-containing protein n=1 Tax=Phytophthora palmivora TaxID=4796 RepID=A0A2P4X1Z4_9STRA|nr:hypothetical protein PHPALM_31673 [Phytophthora palmivora]